MKNILMCLAALVAAPATAGISAPTPIVVGGQLTGANGVSFNGQLYNVAFRTGSCDEVFNGCHAANDFDFSTRLEAQQAAQALLDQVFVTLDGIDYDTDFGRILGCASEYNACGSWVPYGTSNGSVQFAVAQQTDSFGDIVQAGSAQRYENPFLANYARFTLADVGGVPEPATWAMMIGGFGMVGAAARRRAPATAAA